MSTCTICSKELIGNQRKYCSKKCQYKCENHKYQNYAAQQARGLERKIHFVNLFGGKCMRCGYNTNVAALCFHHTRDKKFTIDIRTCSNNSMETLMEEVQKCELLCSNCHAEHHNPQMTGLLGFLAIA